MCNNNRIFKCKQLVIFLYTVELIFSEIYKKSVKRVEGGDRVRDDMWLDLIEDGISNE